MSRIALSPPASGTATFTLSAPATNTDRTLSLPDAAGTIQVSGNPISGTTGTFTGLVDISAAGAGQIAFPATQNASANANTLDDYEEGTFTPAIAGQTSAGTGTYSSQDGRYTKIGRFVHVVITLVWSAHTGTGNMLVTGLPFTNLAGDNPSAVNLVSNITVTGQVATEITSGATSGRMFSLNNGTSAQLTLDTAGTYELTIGYFTS